MSLLVSEAPENVEAGIITKALLDAVGFTVNIENAPISQVTARQFTGDYEIVIGGLAPSDADLASTYASTFMPGGATNLTGIDDPELTEAAAEFKAAADLDSQKAALNRLQEVFNRVQPFTVVADAEQYVIVDETVKGVAPTLASVVLLDGAYVSE